MGERNNTPVEWGWGAAVKAGWRAGSLVMRRGGMEGGGIIESKSPAFSLYSISQRAAGREKQTVASNKRNELSGESGIRAT